MRTLPSPPSPIELGMPAKFTRWRPNQWEALELILNSPQRFIGLCAPTGFGKTVTYMAAARLMGGRVVVITSTKGLQDQLEAEFRELSTDIRGMQNYICAAAGQFHLPLRTRVIDGPCLHGAHCGLRADGCDYFDQYRAAQFADIVVTNYQCWMHDKGGLRSERPVSMLILDEAHSILDHLSDYLSVELERQETMALAREWPNQDLAPEMWVKWTGDRFAYLNDEIETLKERIKAEGPHPGVLHEIRIRQDLARKLEKVATMRGEWVIEPRYGGRAHTLTACRFDPLWPQEYAERALFRGSPKIVLVSATMRPKTAQLLGVSQNEMAFAEYPSSFPIDRRPVIQVPCVQMNYRTEANDAKMMWMLRKMDLLLKARGDRKGVIHTVSYKRARFLMDNSQHADRMLVHGNDNRADVIEKFKQAAPGAVLVSPSVDTGYDFYRELAEYQLIVKIPFQDNRDAVMKARNKGDKEWGMYVTCQTLQQMTGRIMRAPDDRGECVAPTTKIITDDLRWVEAHTVKEGDRILGFHENGKGRKDPRRWQWSHVIKSVVRKMPRVRVVYEDGEMICTPNHPWLVLAKGSVIGWCHAAQLKEGQKLFRLLQPWSSPTTWIEGWLAGFYDGEGCLMLRSGRRNPNVNRIVASQKEGPLLWKACEHLSDCGFNFYLKPVPNNSQFNSTGQQFQVEVRGGHSELLRFLGQIRPQRLLNKFLEHNRDEKISAISYPKVLRVETLSPGDISSLQTSTGTYVAEGMGAHNTLVLDDNFSWVVKDHRKFFSGWFMESVQRAGAMLPAPPPKL